MGTSVKLPDPVYERVSREAKRQDVTRGAVVKEWMEKAERFDELEVVNNA